MNSRTTYALGAVALVVIALIVNPEGFPLSYETFDGDRTDVTTLEAVMRMVERKYGKIVFLSSTSALGNRGQTNYSTAKAGLQGMALDPSTGEPLMSGTISGIVHGKSEAGIQLLRIKGGAERLIANRLAVLGLVIIGFVVLVAVLAPLIAPFDPTAHELTNTFAKPDGEHLMGIGALATVAAADPPNLTVVVLDNGRYGETGGQPVAAIALRCKIRIEPHRRRYSGTEAQRLHDLFGDTSRWGSLLGRFRR